MSVTVSFKRAGGGTAGWEIDFRGQLPQIGDEIMLADREGEPLHRLRVTNVRHLCFAVSDGYSARSLCVEVDAEEEGTG